MESVWGQQIPLEYIKKWEQLLIYTWPELSEEKREEAAKVAFRRLEYLKCAHCYYFLSAISDSVTDQKAKAFNEMNDSIYE